MFCPKCGCELDDEAKFCEKCGEALYGGVDAPAKKVKSSGGGKVKKAMTAIGTLVLLSVVALVTVNLTKNFLGDINGTSTAAPNNSEAETVSGQNSKTSTSDKDDEFGKEMAKVFAKTYSYDWKVKKYTEDGKTWKTYDLGKKMFIVAYNFLNDQTFTTGGKQFAGYSIQGTSNQSILCPKCKADNLRPETLLSANWICGVCGYKEYRSNKASITPQYEWVPEETHEYHGKDIYYECPQITITPDSVDMRGMGGGVYSISDFRYEETSSGYDRIVNDECKFALEYDGKYMNYKEPDEYGYYVGFYAYDTTDSLVNITYVHDSAEYSKS